jgi:xanthine/uracil permease
LRRIIPIIIGAIVLLIGIGWASQGAGMMGGSSLMDNNSTFIYLGSIVAVLGLALIAFGAISKPRIKATASA